MTQPPCNPPERLGAGAQCASTARFRGSTTLLGQARKLLLVRAMKTMLTLVLVAACSHSEPPPVTPLPPVETTAAADPLIDPTLPSWAPRSCASYHAAVVRVLDCDALEGTKKAQIKAQYDVDHAKWDAMHDEPLDAISQVGEDCKASLANLHVTYDASCATTAQTP